MEKVLCQCLLVCALMFRPSAIQAASTNSFATGAQTWPKADPAAVAPWQLFCCGMFVHWGSGSLTGQEIGGSRGAQSPMKVHDNLFKQFNWTKFSADNCVNIAKAVGRKYLVLTKKHHDEFCLWDTKLTDYNIMLTPFRRDGVKDLAAAGKQEDMDFDAYYVGTDCYDQDWPVPVTAREFCRNILDATDGPAIAEIKLVGK